MSLVKRSGAIREMKEKNNLKSDSSKKFAFSFDGRFVIVLFLVLGFISLWVAINLKEGFLKELLVVVSGGLITTGLFELILYFSSQLKNLEELNGNIINAKTEVLEKLESKEEKEIITKRMIYALHNLKKVEGTPSDLGGHVLGDLKRDLGTYADYLLDYMQYSVNPQMVYIDSFVRNVKISKGKINIDTCVQVETDTEVVYVNLSDQPYKFSVNPQFLIGDASGNTYNVKECEEGNRNITVEIQDQIRSCKLREIKGKSLYEDGLKFSIEIPSCTAKRIRYVTTHEMPLEMFYQAKSFNLPCRTISLKAEWSEEFKNDLEKDYIFRWTIFESRYRDHQKVTAKGDKLIENFNEAFGLNCEWFKPGNGFVLTAGFIDKEFKKKQTQIKRDFESE